RVLIPTPSFSEIVRQEAPEARSEAILAASTTTLGRPSRLPLARACRRPALTRSWISDHSNSAIAAIIWNISRLEGVPRSKLSLKLTNAKPTASSSARALIRCLSDLPKRFDLPDCDHVELALARISHQSIERRARLLSTRRVIDVFADDLPGASCGVLSQFQQLHLGILGRECGHPRVQSYSLRFHGCAPYAIARPEYPILAANSKAQRQ